MSFVTAPPVAVHYSTRIWPLPGSSAMAGTAMATKARPTIRYVHLSFIVFFLPEGIRLCLSVLDQERCFCRRAQLRRCAHTAAARPASSVEQTADRPPPCRDKGKRTASVPERHLLSARASVEVPGETSAGVPAAQNIPRGAFALCIPHRHHVVRREGFMGNAQVTPFNPVYSYLYHTDGPGSIPCVAVPGRVQGVEPPRRGLGFRPGYEGPV